MFYYRKKVKFLVLYVLLIVGLWSVGYCLTKIDWAKQIDEPFQVSLIQGNISLERKWDAYELPSILASYAYLTTQSFDSKIIIWPEAAIPDYPENVSLHLEKLSLAAKAHNTTILSGIPFYDARNECYYNGIIAFGASDGHYYKRHLVPFGEYMPLRFILGWLHHYLTIPMSGFSSGSKHQADLFIGKVILAPFICYEIAYASLVLDYLPRAGFLVTVCEDSWFGESIASSQHLEIARMRSLEVGRDQLLATSTGITAVIDAHGKIISQAPIFKQAVLTAKIQALAGATPWVKCGQYFWLLILLIILGAVKWNMAKGQKHRFWT